MSHDSHASARPASTPPYAAARPTGMVSPGTQPLRSRAQRQQTPLPAVSAFGPPTSHRPDSPVPYPTRDPIPPPDVRHTPASVPPTDIGSPHVRFSPDQVPLTDVRISSSIQRQSNVLTSTLQQTTSLGWLSDPLPIALDEIYCNDLMFTTLQRSFALNLNLVTIQALVAFSRKPLHDLFAATPQRDLEHDDIIETLAQIYALGQYLDKLEPPSNGTRASIDVFPSTEPGTNAFLTSRWNMNTFKTATRKNWSNLRTAFFDSVDSYLDDPHTGSVVSATSSHRSRRLDPPAFLHDRTTQ